MTETTHRIPDTQADLSFGRLTLGSTDARGNGWFGMAALVTTEACLFAYLLFSYYYMALHYGRDWLPPELPGFKFSIPMTALLFTSSVVVWIGERGIKQGRSAVCAIALAGGALLGIAFVALEATEWADKDFTISTDSYSSLYFTVTGFHMAHVVGGVIMLLAVALWTALGKFDAHRRDPVSIAAFYWHFVDVVWVAVFTTIYVTPHLFN
ncbi:heme-copper oxidase subunit III [Roseovarius spongiae]|uniref:Heme-copper oxidase subunit III n=1 Tax=Roseovarius spongiae TaxID=2320272 RepID=A0A3A8B7F6_9RHOB|nr:cytochrome c oxidase subunit 3 [Roseovarius spongiae]RKF12663.1 heme-copper oxidase subunit III [Roseovarius spongiae]